MNFHVRRVQTATVEITPLIDVVFILLIFFMVTSTFVAQPQLEITLPESDSAALPQSPDALDIYINVDGEFSIGNGDPIPTSQASVVDLLRELALENQDSLVLVHADADTRHQSVVHVLAALAELNMSQVHIVSTSTVTR